MTTWHRSSTVAGATSAQVAKRSRETRLHFVPFDALQATHLTPATQDSYALSDERRASSQQVEHYGLVHSWTCGAGDTPAMTRASEYSRRSLRDLPQGSIRRCQTNRRLCFAAAPGGI